jgi:sigma-B regulation protein RsbU (phosphoserine phosphatase)
MIANEDKLTTRVEWGLTDEVVRGIRRKTGEGVVDGILENHTSLLIENLMEDKRFNVARSSRQIHSLVSLPLFTNSRDLGVLNVVNTRGGESFSPENLATLQTVAGMASTAIENAILHREAIEREVFQEQLRIARQIWENILPSSIPHFSGASISARSVPASIVGGDFYDFIPLGEDRLGLVIADVSGKGIPAAMVMNMAKSVLHVEALRDNEPDQVLSVVNNLLVESTRPDSFVTLVYAVLDRKAKQIIFTNAGHTPCLIHRAATGECESVQSENLPLAILPDLDFVRQTVDVFPGDSIVLYTDGVTEAMNSQRELFDNDRLVKIMENIGDEESAEEAMERIYKSVEEFAGDAPRSDDTTVVMIKIRDI